MKPIEQYEQAAMKGSAEDQYNLGMCYLTGNGVLKDDHCAFMLFRMAADQNFAPAISKKYEMLYEHGDKFPSLEYADSFYAERAAKDSADMSDFSRYILCIEIKLALQKQGIAALQTQRTDDLTTYSTAVLAIDDMDKKLKLLKLNIKKTHEGIQRKLQQELQKIQQKDLAIQDYDKAAFYFKEGPEQDFKKAAELFKSAADNGLAEAQFSLGQCYNLGQGVVKNEEQGFYYHMLAASQGNARSQCSVGYNYLTGRGFENAEKNYKLAIEYFNLAAKQGNPEAQSNLGYCYLNGLGVEIDHKKAFEFFEQGKAAGLYNLAMCYQNGNGVDKDTKYALELYYQATIQGEESAQKALQAHYKIGDGQDKSRAKILEHTIGPENAKVPFNYFTNYIVKHSQDSSGLAMLAFFYQFGIGTERDVKVASDLYEQYHQKKIDWWPTFYWDLFLCKRELFTSGQLSKEKLKEFYAELKVLADKDSKETFEETYKDTSKEISDATPKEISESRAKRNSEENSEAAKLMGYLYERNVPELDQNLFTAYDYYKKANSLNPKDQYSEEKVKKYKQLLDSNAKLFELFKTEIFEKDELHLPPSVVRIISEYASPR